METNNESIITKIFNETTEFEIEYGLFVQKAKVLLEKGPYPGNLNLSKTYMTKPFIKYNDKSVFPEIFIVKKCIENGMNACWIDSFHKKAWCDMPNTMKYMDVKENNILKQLIELNGKKTTGCWDVFAWNKDIYYFIEAKGIPSNDKIRSSQIE